MTAQIIYMADYRAQRVQVRITFDPLVAWRAWWDFLCGVRK